MLWNHNNNNYNNNNNNGMDNNNNSIIKEISTTTIQTTILNRHFSAYILFYQILFNIHYELDQSKDDL